MAIINKQSQNNKLSRIKANARAIGITDDLDNISPQRAAEIVKQLETARASNDAMVQQRQRQSIDETGGIVGAIGRGITDVGQRAGQLAIQTSGVGGSAPSAGATGGKSRLDQLIDLQTKDFKFKQMQREEDRKQREFDRKEEEARLKLKQAEIDRQTVQDVKDRTNVPQGTKTVGTPGQVALGAAQDILPQRGGDALLAPVEPVGEGEERTPVNAFRGGAEIAEEQQRSNIFTDAADAAVSGRRTTPDLSEKTVKTTEGDVSTTLTNIANVIAEERAKSGVSIDADLQKFLNKESVKAEAVATRANLNFNNQLEAFVELGKDQLERGLKPGLLSGLTMRALFGPTRANDFVAAFDSTAIEAAAAAGAASIPGTRASRIINIFKKTGISINDTMESAINTIIRSMGTAIGQDMSRNPWEWIPEWDGLTSEEKFNAWNQLPKIQRLDISRGKLAKIQQEYILGARAGLEDKMFAVEPELFKRETQTKIQKRQEGTEKRIAVESLGLDPDQYEIVEE